MYGPPSTGRLGAARGRDSVGCGLFVNSFFGSGAHQSSFGLGAHESSWNELLIAVPACPKDPIKWKGSTNNHNYDSLYRT